MKNHETKSGTYKPDGLTVSVLRTSTPKISEHMRRALEVIRAGGGSATPEGGGWWKGADRKRLRYQNVALGGDYTEVVTTNTIYALARRGLVKRTGKFREAWRDTYVALDEQDCPGHVASERDPKICGRCGVHIDSLRPTSSDMGDRTEPTTTPAGA